MKHLVVAFAVVSTSLVLAAEAHDIRTPRTAPTIEPHAAASQSVFRSREATGYRHLAAWIGRVTAKQAPRRPATVSRTDVTLSQAISPPVESAHRGHRPGPSSEATGSAAGTATTMPRDPFDPEIFNRRFHPNAK